MKRFLVLLCGVSAAAFLAGSALIYTLFYIDRVPKAEREAIERQVVAMRDAVQKNDQAAIAELVVPILRNSAPGASFFEAHVGPGPEMPTIPDVRNDEATLTRDTQYYFGIIPHGSTILMKKVHGVWYFTKQLSID